MRSAGSVSDTAERVQSFFCPIAVERIIGVGLTADRSSPQVTGSVITFTASPFPAAAAQYKWWLFDGLTWTTLRDWDANATFTWTAAMPGNYRIGVWARGAGVTTDAAQAVHSVGFDIADLVVAISSDRPAP